MKYYLIAGEASGDLHGSNLMKALLEQDPEAEFRFWGGDQMKTVGGTMVKHISDLAFMGFAEVIANLRTILGNIRFCKKDIERWQADALILIDYPGFNRRIAKWGKAKGIKIFYYISPQIWAWRTHRVHEMAKNTDRILAILPFEKDFYKKFGYDIDFVGHPLLDVVNTKPAPENFRKRNKLDDRPIIALLPGSRKQEISRMLGAMLEMIPAFPEHQFIIAGAPAIGRAFYESLSSTSLPPVLFGQTHELLQSAEAGLVASGTATLEAALFDLPQVVCYKGAALNFWLFRSMIKVRYISLVNLILDKLVVKELIQNKLTSLRLKKELSKILGRGERKRIKQEYQQLRKVLGDGGASKKVAQIIWQDIHSA